MPTIEYTNYVPTNGFVSVGSRYSNASIIYWGPLRKITFTTYKKRSYPFKPSDKFTVISPGMENRPDKMSSSVYGVPDFWWKIMEANHINDIYDFKAGLNVRLPDVDL